MAQTGIKDIVIVGGGTAGWMSAAFLSRIFNSEGSASPMRITLIESPDIRTVGVGEATIPPIIFFNQILGVNEADFMRRTQGSIKLGIDFVGWQREGHRYIHPFGAFGAPINGVSFHAYWLRARQAGLKADISDYSLSAQAAYKGKFRLPNNDPRSGVPNVNYAYHFDANLYAQFLRGFAEARGVRRLEGTIKTAELDPHDGTISHLVLTDGSELKGDLFIDCTGFRSLLLGQTMGVEFQDWSHYLPCNRAVATTDERVGPPPPYTRATAKKAGWIWRIPLQHRTGTGYVFNDAEISEDEAAHTLVQSLEGRSLVDPWFLRFTAGRRRVARVKNCVAIGLSLGFLEPLESTTIHLIQHGLIKLAATFPIAKIDETSAKLYNEIMVAEVEQVRDFVMAHYVLNERKGEALWDYVRHMDIPDSLRFKFDLFRERGLAIYPDQTVFREENWVAIMLGQGLMPKTYDPVADTLDGARMKQHLDYMRRVCAETSDQMPTLDEFLRKYCPAPFVAPPSPQKA
ncbi:MAG: tryptophan halogenase family protein [Asticcacaulis sp.]